MCRLCSESSSMPVATASPNDEVGWVVQSFSGDSIRTAASRIVCDIVPRYLSHCHLAIVCSACVTNTSQSTSQLLLHAASKAHKHRRRDIFNCSPSVQDGPHAKFAFCAELFRFEYSNLAKELIRNSLLVESMRMIIDKECGRLYNMPMLSAYAEIPDIEDMILLTSEVLSSYLLNHILLDRGFLSEVIFAEDTEATVRQNMPQGNVIDHFLTALAKRVRASYPKIPIITGMVTFPEFPKSQKRGSSEPLSMLLAIGLKASELQLWDAGNGVITADSRRVSSARFVQSISSAEANEMAQHGRPCASPAVLEQVTSKDISVKLGDTNDNDLRSTTIRTPLESFASTPLTPNLKPTEPLRLSSPKSLLTNRRPTAVIAKETAFMLKITATTLSAPVAFIGNVFRVLEHYGVDPDMVSSAHMHIAIVVDEDRFEGDVGALADELGQYGIVLVQYGLSIVTLVGDQMRQNGGISGHVVSTLTQGGIRVNMVGPGTGTSLSCAISSKELTKAVRLLHNTLFRKIDRNAGSSKATFLE
ncbi:hypothetical protein BDN70DRAFT_326508 [Pholiota conissans]|uniref:aspartate kinase n=1 Tax=Pholiota conissans TaxID=109636 RepID=A0A9P5ZAI1_9AGAR|nr:hypothetical protein BDN70DRAFT_326508 [Pholiota conissans]